MFRVFVWSLFALILGGSLLSAAPVHINAGDTVVIYGDSITEQNRYAAYLETFLLTRFPQAKLQIYNYGMSGDTAGGGNNRFARDAGSVKPTLVFVNFGMNDGGYRPYDEGIVQGYLRTQRQLAATIKAADAREVLLTTSPIDYDRRADGDVYNDTLAHMADGLIGLGKELDVPVIDQFHPLRTLQKELKTKSPGFTMIPDSIHPNEVGHLAMAYYILKGIEMPTSAGDIVIDHGTLTKTGNAKVTNLKAADSTLEFDMTLPFIPFFVPNEARPALDMVPFQQDLNALSFTANGLSDQYLYWVQVDGKDTVRLSADQLAGGVDLARLDGAGWTEQGRKVWDTAQFRWQRHFEAWRTYGLMPPSDLTRRPEYVKFVEAAHGLLIGIDDYMNEIAQPRTYHVALRKVPVPVVQAIDLSPVYPYTNEFDKAYPPETEPDKVEWKTVPFGIGQFDFASMFNNPTNCVIYGRIILQADADCQLPLSLGSDDGLAVFLNGTRILANNTSRGLVPGQDHVTANLKQGRNVLLFRVNQGGGGFGLAIDMQMPDGVTLKQVK